MKHKIIIDMIISAELSLRALSLVESSSNEGLVRDPPVFWSS